MNQTVIETPDGWMIRCQNCGYHTFPKAGRPGASWTFDGNLISPTFRPSMNETLGPYPEGSQWAGQIRRCHFTVTCGRINYHNDCTHALRGPMPLLPWDQADVDFYRILMEGK